MNIPQGMEGREDYKKSEPFPDRLAEGSTLAFNWKESLWTDWE